MHDNFLVLIKMCNIIEDVYNFFFNLYNLQLLSEPQRIRYGCN